MSDAVESKEEQLIGGTITESGKVRDTRKFVKSVEGIMSKVTITTVYFGSCGHLLHSEEDVGGMCRIEKCGNIPCSRCFKLCGRCQKALCNRHMRFRNGVAFCSSCRWKVMLTGWRGPVGSESQVS